MVSARPVQGRPSRVVPDHALVLTHPSPSVTIMSRVTCRCGEVISVKSDSGPERVACPKCGARIRLRRKAAASASALIGGPGGSGDGYIRFHCPCGRRLKILATSLRTAGKCPDCGRLVPVPEPAGAGPTARSVARVDPDARTEDL